MARKGGQKITPKQAIEGLPVGYEVFDGNRRDVTTLEEMVELMEHKYGKAQRVWVFDRGIVSEDNLDYLRKRGARYIVGTLRDELKQFEKHLSEKDWEEVECGVEVKIVKHPEHGEEKFVLCRSQGRAEKERAMLKRQLDKLTVEFKKIKKGIKERRLKSKDITKIDRRIGRWQGKNLNRFARWMWCCRSKITILFVYAWLQNRMIMCKFYCTGLL